MKIYYGLIYKNIDVTEVCFEKLQKDNIIFIPKSDYKRDEYFGDPLLNVFKKIFISDYNNVTTEYDTNTSVVINLTTGKIKGINDSDCNFRLSQIHEKLQLNHGKFNEELALQRLSMLYLTGNEKILEIGGNIGRISLVIASILREKNNRDLVVLESDSNNANFLRENRDKNKMSFFIEDSALSKRNLIQLKSNTIEHNTLLEGYKPVKSILFHELISRYNVVFDTLILNCGFAAYYIFLDMPEVLDNIKLLIMTNEYWDVAKKKYIDDLLEFKGFYREYFEQHDDKWYQGPHAYNYYEVWVRR